MIVGYAEAALDDQPLSETASTAHCILVVHPLYDIPIPIFLGIQNTDETFDITYIEIWHEKGRSNWPVWFGSGDHVRKWVAENLGDIVYIEAVWFSESPSWPDDGDLYWKEFGFPRDYSKVHTLLTNTDSYTTKWTNIYLDETLRKIQIEDPELHEIFPSFLDSISTLKEVGLYIHHIKYPDEPSILKSHNNIYNGEIEFLYDKNGDEIPFGMISELPVALLSGYIIDYFDFGSSTYSLFRIETSIDTFQDILLVIPDRADWNRDIVILKNDMFDTTLRKNTVTMSDLVWLLRNHKEELIGNVMVLELKTEDDEGQIENLGRVLNQNPVMEYQEIRDNFTFFAPLTFYVPEHIGELILNR